MSFKAVPDKPQILEEPTRQNESFRVEKILQIDRFLAEVPDLLMINDKIYLESSSQQSTCTNIQTLPERESHLSFILDILDIV
ncbi:hypothetical protein TcasGA2_TC004707 [Tribolium castaneum]|uniref:Uncharacterized protein n=1 Tax=Tribolium castaneum TaxID=7070 RepID=D6W6H2_TRICA|nr:hypothetical protein TcasGA2_TC004707 [Tribolium castaneum]